MSSAGERLRSFGWLGWNEPPKRNREAARRDIECRPLFFSSQCVNFKLLGLGGTNEVRRPKAELAAKHRSSDFSQAVSSALLGTQGAERVWLDYESQASGLQSHL